MPEYFNDDDAATPEAAESPEVFGDDSPPPGVGRVTYQTAKAIAGELPVTFDPMLILAIISVIIGLVNMWRNCNVPEGIADASQRYGPMTKALLCRHARKALRKHNLNTQLADEIAAKVLEYARKDTDRAHSVILECQP